MKPSEVIVHASSPGDETWRVVARSRYVAGDADALTTTIVSLVAEVEGVAPRDVTDPPLYDVVDVEAFGRECAAVGRGSGATADVDSCAFTYRGHRVVVRADGWVLIHERVAR